MCNIRKGHKNKTLSADQIISKVSFSGPRLGCNLCDQSDVKQWAESSALGGVVDFSYTTLSLALPRSSHNIANFDQMICIGNAVTCVLSLLLLSYGQRCPQRK